MSITNIYAVMMPLITFHKNKVVRKATLFLFDYSKNNFNNTQLKDVPQIPFSKGKLKEICLR